ncbi:MAG: hypothetical protein JXA72_03310 [Bacteroidales bacterium]|nr:hypothetical protein [Bacteroidales bacterium]
MDKLLYWLLWACVLTSNPIAAQPEIHSHNDYLQNLPLWEAVVAGCASVEADVILINDTLFVAHALREIRSFFTFEALYCKPASQLIGKGGVYAHATFKRFHLLIDIKTERLSTLSKLCAILAKYPQVFDPENNENAIRIIVSGNRPSPDLTGRFPDYLLYDARTPAEALRYGRQIGMISRNFSDFSKWNGVGEPVDSERQNLEAFIKSCHEGEVKVRFWNTPDTEDAYHVLSSLGVDYLNTDHPFRVRCWLQHYENQQEVE